MNRMYRIKTHQIILYIPINVIPAEAGIQAGFATGYRFSPV